MKINQNFNSQSDINLSPFVNMTIFVFYMSKKSLILVIIQFSSFAYFLFSGKFLAQNFWLFLQIVGFVISLWGVLAMKLGNFNIQPEVKPTAHFITTGPYKIIRNPMYTGIILFFGAAAISNYSVLHLIVFTILFIVLLAKIRMEEKFLVFKFGDRYINYLKKSYRLVPLIY